MFIYVFVYFILLLFLNRPVSSWPLSFNQYTYPSESLFLIHNIRLLICYFILFIVPSSNFQKLLHCLLKLELPCTLSVTSKIFVSGYNFSRNVTFSKLLVTPYLLSGSDFHWGSDFRPDNSGCLSSEGVQSLPRGQKKGSSSLR